jgi:serine/threonine-protein kinase
MAPELAGGALATVRSDIYALGVLLYNLLTGKYPTGDGSTWTLLEARPDLPAALVKTIHKAAHPEPAQRFASAGELAAALGECDAAGKGKSQRYIGIGLAAVLIGAVAMLGYEWSKSVPAAVAQRYEKAHDLVQHYYRPQALESAIPELEKIVKLQPGYAAASADLGRANFLQFWQKKDRSFVDPAKKASAAAVALDPNLASPHVTLGMLYTQTGNNDLAAQELDTAMRIDRTNAEVWAARAELYYRQGRTEDVEPSIRRAIALAPSDWRWPKQLADFYDRTGHKDLAIAAAQSAVKLTPDNARAYNNLGIYLRDAGRLKEAEDSLRQAIAIEPSVNRYTNLGGVERDLGNLDLAIQMFREAIGLSPDDYVAWENLAIVYRRQNDEVQMRQAYRKAIEIAERQRVVKPRDPWLLGDLGGMYAVLGDSEHAVPLLSQAAALDPEDGDLLYRAGVSFEALHRREDAVPLIAAALHHGVPRSKAEQDPGVAAILNDRRFLAITQGVR